MQIKTNNKPRTTFDASGLTKAEQVTFAGSDGPFVRFKGSVLDLSRFEPASHADWTGRLAQTFYSGLLYRRIDSDTVVIGTYTA